MAHERLIGLSWVALAQGLSFVSGEGFFPGLVMLAVN